MPSTTTPTKQPHTSPRSLRNSTMKEREVIASLPQKNSPSAKSAKKKLNIEDDSILSEATSMSINVSLSADISGRIEGEPVTNISNSSGKQKSEKETVNSPQTSELDGSTNIETTNEDNVLNIDSPTTESISIVGDPSNSEGVTTVSNDQPIVDRACASSATVPMPDQSQQSSLAEVNGSANPSKKKKANHNEELILFRSKANKDNTKLDKKTIFTTDYENTSTGVVIQASAMYCEHDKDLLSVEKIVKIKEFQVSKANLKKFTHYNLKTLRALKDKIINLEKDKKLFYAKDSAKEKYELKKGRYMVLHHTSTQLGFINIYAKEIVEKSSIVTLDELQAIAKTGTGKKLILKMNKEDHQIMWESKFIYAGYNYLTDLPINFKNYQIHVEKYRLIRNLCPELIASMCIAGYENKLGVKRTLEELSKKHSIVLIHSTINRAIAAVHANAVTQSLTPGTGNGVQDEVLQQHIEFLESVKAVKHSKNIKAVSQVIAKKASTNVQLDRTTLSVKRKRDSLFNNDLPAKKDSLKKLGKEAESSHLSNCVAVMDLDINARAEKMVKIGEKVSADHEQARVDISSIKKTQSRILKRHDKLVDINTQNYQKLEKQLIDINKQNFQMLEKLLSERFYNLEKENNSLRKEIAKFQK